MKKATKAMKAVKTTVKTTKGVKTTKAVKTKGREYHSGKSMKAMKAMKTMETNMNVDLKRDVMWMQCLHCGWRQSLQLHQVQVSQNLKCCFEEQYCLECGLSPYRLGNCLKKEFDLLGFLV